MAHHYQLAEPATTIAAPISGRYLAHNRHDHIAHAFFAGDLVLRKTRLVQPTMTQAAFLAGVNRPYVHWALKRQAERAKIERGLIPLVPAAPMRANGNGTALVAPETGIDDAQLMHIATLVGTDRMLAAAIAAGH
jgi:hypothetical protein